MLKLSCAAITKTGRRHNNQDNYSIMGKCAPLDHDARSETFVCESSKPFVASVCDGMGGESFGERASFIACSEISDAAAKLTSSFSNNKKLVSEAILHANALICKTTESDDIERMGSTVASVLIHGETLWFTNLGDTRIYVLRGEELTQITKDHTEGQSMVDAGVLTQEKLKTHPSRNKLSQHLGIFPDEMKLECPAYGDIQLQGGDKILICSDGVYGSVSDENIAAILRLKCSEEMMADKLIAEAYENGSKDNMTAMVISVKKRFCLFFWR